MNKITQSDFCAGRYSDPSIEKSHDLMKRAYPKDQVAEIFSYKDPVTGISACVSHVQYYSSVRVRRHGKKAIPSHQNQIRVSGFFETAEKKIGQFERMIHICDNTFQTCEHKSMYLQRQYRGLGFASRYFTTIKARYKAEGIEKITLYAGEQNGGYTWVKLGFVPVGRIHFGNGRYKSVESFLASLKNVSRSKKISLDTRTTLIGLLDKKIDFDATKVVDLGLEDQWRSRSGHHLGKHILINTSWEGEMLL